MNDFKYIDNSFVEQNEGLIRLALNKYLYYTGLNDDILQEARIWLCEAKQKYNKKRGSAWTTYAKYYIQQSYLNYVRKNKLPKRHGEALGITNICIDNLYENDLYKLWQDNGNDLDNELERKYIYKYCLESIKDEKVRDIVKLRLDGASCRIIAYKYRCTKSWISLIYKTEMDRIRNVLKTSDWGKEFNPYKKNTIPVKDKIDIKKIKELRDKGVAWKKICLQLHIGYHELFRYIYKNDYPLGGK